MLLFANILNYILYFDIFVKNILIFQDSKSFNTQKTFKQPYRIICIALRF